MSRKEHPFATLFPFLTKVNRNFFFRVFLQTHFFFCIKRNEDEGRLLEQAALEQLELEALKENAADLQAIDCEPTDKRNPLARSDRAR